MDDTELKPIPTLGNIVSYQEGENIHTSTSSSTEGRCVHVPFLRTTRQSSVQVQDVYGNSLCDGSATATTSILKPQNLIGPGQSFHSDSQESCQNVGNLCDVGPTSSFSPGCSSQLSLKRKHSEAVLGSSHSCVREPSLYAIPSRRSKGSHSSGHPLPHNNQQACQCPLMSSKNTQVQFFHAPDISGSNNVQSTRANCHVNRPVFQYRNPNEGTTLFNFQARRAAVRLWGNVPLSIADPYLWDVMEKEKARQWRGIELIASENFTSLAVMEALGSHLTNKYSEGLPGSRYYGGNEYIDQIESLCIQRALAAFQLDSEKWGVNVQPYSCTSANFAVFTALLQPKDRIMGLDVSSGGHVSHGYYTVSGKKVSGASIFFESLPFKVHHLTGMIDLDRLEDLALLYRPKILICGGSAYPREWDYARFRDIANRCQAILMCDMAHISGLIAAQECKSPFQYCDIVTSTTHKSLRGPRGGMIFFRKGLKSQKKDGGIDVLSHDFEDKINFAVHPSLQGGPHNNHIAALAVALMQVATPEFKLYIQQVKRNSQALAAALLKRGCKLVTGGTDNHLLLWDLRPMRLTGNRFERVCEMCHITVNKIAVFGDSSALAPGGVRIGTLAMTSRGCIEADFELIADFLMKAVEIAENVQLEHGKLQKDFIKGLQNNLEIEELKNCIEKFAISFEMPGFEVTTMKYNH